MRVGIEEVRPFERSSLLNTGGSRRRNTARSDDMDVLERIHKVDDFDSGCDGAHSLLM